jgi:hypothetical protein
MTNGTLSAVSMAVGFIGIVVLVCQGRIHRSETIRLSLAMLGAVALSIAFIRWKTPGALPLAFVCLGYGWFVFGKHLTRRAKSRLNARSD